MKLFNRCTIAALLIAGSASAEIKIVEAEDAIILGTNYVVATDTNFPVSAFSTNYISPTATSTLNPPPLGDKAVYSVGNLTSNMEYDLYIRLHVGTNTYGDDSIFISEGFETNSFDMQNGLAGAETLDGASTTSDGFHWVKMNGALDLSWKGAYNAGAGTNLLFSIAPREDGLDIDALAFVTADIPVTDEMLNPTNSGTALWPIGYQPDAPTTDSTPDIQAYYMNGAETVDTNNISMTLNGEPVSGITTSYTNSITTVNYTPDTALTAGSTYTALVVVASSPSGVLYTNEWTFEVESFPLIYVDAAETNTIMATSTNGPVGTGTYLMTVSDSAVDGTWRLRTGFGIAPTVTNGPTGTIALNTESTLFESHDWQGADNVPRLKTSVSGLDEHIYATFVYFWSDGNGWCIRAGLEDTEGTNSLALIDANSTNAVAVGDDGSRTLYKALIGYVEGTAIDVYIEDLPGESSNDRVWYDGIGYQQVDGVPEEPPVGPSIDPDIKSITISGETITLTWTSETAGTYTILHKASLSDSEWTAVKSDIAGDETTTTDSVPASGTGAEFFIITGE